jgi:hypothetical protein
MTEFAGYIATTPVNWGKVAQEASRGIFDVLEERQEERKKLDDLSANAQRELVNFERDKSASINNRIMAGAQTGRSYIQAQNDLLKSGRITPEEYKRNVQNIQVGFKTYDTFLKGVGEDNREHLKRLDEGIASQQEMYQYKQRTALLSQPGSTIQISPSGGFYIKPVDGEPVYIESQLNPENRFVSKVQLDKDASNFVKTLGMTSQIDPATGKYVTSQTVDDEIIDKGVEGILQGNMSKIASVLVDTAGTHTFDPEEAKKSGKKLIELKVDENGISRPVLSESEISKAKKYTRAVIKGKLSYKESDDRMLELKKKSLDIAKEKNKIARQRNAIAAKKAAGGDVEEDNSILNRYQRVMDIVSKGPKSEYSSLLVNQVLPFMARRKNEKGELEYEGYTTSGFSLDKEGNIIVQVKRGYGDKADYRKIKYQPEVFISDVNALLNKTQGTKIKEEQLMDIYKGEDSSTTSSSVKPAP